MIERPPASPKLRIDVLGDLTVRVDEVEIALRAPMHRPRPEWDAAVAVAAEALGAEKLASLTRYRATLTFDEALTYARSAARVS